LPTVSAEFSKLPGELTRLAASLTEGPQRIIALLEDLRGATTAAIQKQGEQTRTLTVAEGRQVFEQLAGNVQQMVTELRQAGGEMRTASQGLTAAVRQNGESLGNSAGTMTRGFEQFAQQLRSTLEQMRSVSAGQQELAQQLNGLTQATRESQKSLQASLTELTRTLKPKATTAARPAEEPPEPAKEEEVNKGSWLWPFK
ncbi:MAG: hypothetical protein ACKOFW_22365, partial [Planctomycetaceae bacterium]